MSAWVLGLALSAGYLINKNMIINSTLQESITAYNSAAQPATPLASAEVRQRQRELPASEKYGEINLKQNRKDVDALVEARDGTIKEVAEYEDPLHGGPIQGVLFVPDSFGV